MEKNYQKDYYKRHKEEVLAKKANMSLDQYREYQKIKKEKRIINEYIKLHKEEIKEMKEQRKKEREKVYNFIYFQNNKENIYKRRKGE